MLGFSVKKSFQTGLSLVEFAVVAPLLILLMVAATDFSLAILARQEVHSAARAGIEYAINRGYDPNGISAAALQSTGTSSRKFASISSSGISIYGPKCACYGNVRGAGAADPTPSTSGSMATCSFTKSCTLSGGVAVAPSPYIEVTVSGTYSPIFAGYWWFGLNNGVLGLSAKYVGKTQFVR